MPLKEQIGIKEFLEYRLDQIDDKLLLLSNKLESLEKWQTQQEAMRNQNAKFRNWLYVAFTSLLVCVGLVLRYLKV